MHPPRALTWFAALPTTRAGKERVDEPPPKVRERAAAARHVITEDEEEEAYDA